MHVACNSIRCLECMWHVIQLHSRHLIDLIEWLSTKALDSSHLTSATMSHVISGTMQAREHDTGGVAGCDGHAHAAGGPAYGGVRWCEEQRTAFSSEE
jgi:hypothetical protein